MQPGSSSRPTAVARRPPAAAPPVAPPQGRIQPGGIAGQPHHRAHHIFGDAALGAVALESATPGGRRRGRCGRRRHRAPAPRLRRAAARPNSADEPMVALGSGAPISASEATTISHGMVRYRRTGCSKLAGKTPAKPTRSMVSLQCAPCTGSSSTEPAPSQFPAGNGWPGATGLWSIAMSDNQLVAAGAKDSAFGRLLKQWRSRRGLSQLDLALSAHTTQRHLSFIESGRAAPSRDMVLRHRRQRWSLSLRQQNALLLAAGYAPAWRRARSVGARPG